MRRVTAGGGGANVVVNDMFIENGGEPDEAPLAAGEVAEICTTGGEAVANLDGVASMTAAEELLIRPCVSSGASRS
jgi:hypothetical protein